jgi:ABC-type branched-subunit amino acid transport system substrate-binding protein
MAKVAYLEDIGVPDHVELVSQAFLALTDRLQGSTFEVVELDASSPDAAASAAEDVVDDPAFVAAVIAPFVTVAGSALRRLRHGGIPIVSLSSAPSTVPQAESSASGEGAWIRWVADRSSQAGLLAGLARESAAGGRVCVATAGDPWSEATGRAVLRALGPMAADLGGLQEAEAATRTRCAALVWSGYADDAVAVRRSVPAALPMVVTDGAQTASYLAAAPVGTETLVGCPCVDLSASTALDAQRFLNSFQAANGLGPGVYAAEAWDLGSLIAQAPGGDRRARLDAVFDDLRRYDGVAGIYRLGRGGDGIGVHAARAVGSRWIAFAAPRAGS